MLSLVKLRWFVIRAMWSEIRFVLKETTPVAQIGKQFVADSMELQT